MDYANHVKASSCELKSRLVDVLAIPVDRCANDESDPPVKILSQNGDSVRLSISQVWKGCTSSGAQRMDFVAADYVNMDGDLMCEKHNHAYCGLSSIVEAQCTDGAAVVDLYVHDDEKTNDPVVFQADGSEVAVPDACGTKKSSYAHMCHLRYIVKCRPSLCADESVKRNRRTKTIRRLGQK